MNNETFNSIVQSRLDACSKVLCRKAEEYASDSDRLHNFVVAGRMDNESPVRALWGMWKKHIVSIRDAIERMNSDPTYCPSPEWCAEKLGDNINYTLLLEGLIQDRLIPALKNSTQQSHHSQSIVPDLHPVICADCGCVTYKINTGYFCQNCKKIIPDVKLNA